MTPKIFKFFAILVGTPWLWEALAPYVWEINEIAKTIDDEDSDSKGSMSSDGSSGVNLRLQASGSLQSSSGRRGSLRINKNINFELDPTRLDEAADPKVNTLQLWLTAQKIFSAIVRSWSYLPSELREVLVYVRDEVQQKFNTESYKSVGGFLFLRFICPSMLAPHLFGLMEEPPSPTAQRQLILAGKVLQNLANETLPGAKEEYMIQLNNFIHNNKDELKEFFDLIMAAENLNKADRPVPPLVKQNALARIFNFLHVNYGNIREELHKYYGEGADIFDELDELMQSTPIPRTKNEDDLSD